MIISCSGGQKSHLNATEAAAPSDRHTLIEMTSWSLKMFVISKKTWNWSRWLPACRSSVMLLSCGNLSVLLSSLSPSAVCKHSCSNCFWTCSCSWLHSSSSTFLHCFSMWMHQWQMLTAVISAPMGKVTVETSGHHIRSATVSLRLCRYTLTHICTFCYSCHMTTTKIRLAI